MYLLTRREVLEQMNVNMGVGRRSLTVLKRACRRFEYFQLRRQARIMSQKQFTTAVKFLTEDRKEG